MHMVYVALLRGINVGGKNRVEMARLKIAFESLGFTDVKTYINSGNIIFADSSHAQPELIGIIEKAIEIDFGFTVKVVVKSYEQIKTMATALPNTWVNDNTMKGDVMFLWEAVDNKDVIKQLIIKPDIDIVKYVPGAILWRVDRQNVGRSGLMKIVGTPLYQQITVRNVNTLRKLYALMSV